MATYFSGAWRACRSFKIKKYIMIPKKCAAIKVNVQRKSRRRSEEEYVEPLELENRKRGLD